MFFRSLIISLVFSLEVLAQSAPMCQNWNSDFDGDGWGWENGESCIMRAQGGQSANQQPLNSQPVLGCSAAVQDYDGDGWGFENGVSCRVRGTSQQASTRPASGCSAGTTDDDGDGWGFENGASCRIQVQQSPEVSQSRGPQCSNSVIDYDGDGWGFENGASCRIQTQQPPEVSQSRGPQCSSSVIDYDGDGWAFESGRSCLVGASSGNPDVSTGTRPVGVRFNRSTLKRVGGKGDNWCQTWAADDSVITAMDDGDWFSNMGLKYHSRLYKIWGDADSFTRAEIQNYPNYHVDGDGWFAYGVLSVRGVLYSLVSKTQGDYWSDGPFRGMKLLRSYDSGNSWHRVDRYNSDRYLGRWDAARELLNSDEMFFFEENGRSGKGKTAYPFSYAAFVQSGKDHRESKDGYVYIYSPEGANSHQLLLARVPANQVGQRSAWQYFSGWNNGSPRWSSNIEERQANLTLPERNSRGEYFGWYSWLPSVVWNPGLQLYVMVNGGTYAGDGMSNSSTDYYDRWMHTKTGSLGLWYSENPYGPWKRFYYTDYWTADDSRNLTYQPKLSPKWISEDGRKMTLVWSDAMRNDRGSSHSVHYLWNQMEIDIVTGQ